MAVLLEGSPSNVTRVGSQRHLRVLTGERARNRKHNEVGWAFVYRVGMPRPTLFSLVAFLPTFLISTLALAQDPEPQLVAAINAVQAVDNHAHVVAPDIEHDTDFDALRCDTLPATAAWPIANTRFGPDFQAAWTALYELTADSTSPENLARWQAAQKAARGRLGAGYFAWVAQ